MCSSKANEAFGIWKFELLFHYNFCIFWVFRFVEGYQVSLQLECWILVLALVRLSGEKLILISPNIVTCILKCMLVYCYLLVAAFALMWTIFCRALQEVWPQSLEKVNLVEPSQSMQRAGRSLIQGNWQFSLFK